MAMPNLWTPTAKRLLAEVRPYTRHFVLGLVSMLATVATTLVIPFFLGDLFDRVLQRGNQLMLNGIVIGILLLVLIKGVFSYAQRYSMAFVGQRIVADLRERTFHHLQRLSLAYHESHKSGEQIARVGNDIGLIQNSVSTGLAELIQHVLNILGIFGAMFYTHWRLTLITLAVVPAALVLIARAGRRIRMFSRRQQERTAELFAVLQETLFGIRVVKAFTMEEETTRRFIRENEASFNSSMKSAQAGALLTPAIELLFAGALALIMWYGSTEALAGRLTAGELLRFIALIGLAGTPLTGLTRTMQLFQQSLAAGERIYDLLDRHAEIADRPDAVDLPRLAGRVSFRDVSFSYREGVTVLSHIDLDVEPGEVVAVVGPSGSGKTSLVNLIPRFYDPDEGQVLVDGHDLRLVRAESLRAQIGLVPQETILFGATVRENIGYGRKGATMEEIVGAARAANAHEFITALPDGYETVLGERGASLSGGQRQRLSIARALLRDPRILILDEATSSLDAESERLVQAALETLMYGRTTFVIAHRLSTVRFAQKIIVLDGGVIVERGTHDQLIAAGGLYRRLYERGFQNDVEGREG
ncbi:MAG: ABC transporter ATP-binding protein [Patescibacteria group bacterium]